MYVIVERDYARGWSDLCVSCCVFVIVMCVPEKVTCWDVGCGKGKGSY